MTRAQLKAIFERQDADRSARRVWAGHATMAALHAAIPTRRNFDAFLCEILNVEGDITNGISYGGIA